MAVNGTGGFDVEAMFNMLATNVQQRGESLNAEMKELSSAEGGKISDQQMLRIQFDVNQYNTLLETTSSISKALIDEAKQLAQRSS